VGSDEIKHFTSVILEKFEIILTIFKITVVLIHDNYDIACCEFP